jgi:hypothetical protein
MRLRYWCSSWEGFVGMVFDVPFVVVVVVSFWVWDVSEDEMIGSRAGVAMVYGIGEVDVV